MLSGPQVNSCEPGSWVLSIQSPQMPSEVELKGKSSEEEVSPFHDPERDPIVARGAGWKDLDKNHRTGRTKGHTQFPWRDGEPIHRGVKKAVLESYTIPAVFPRSPVSLGVRVGTRAGRMECLPCSPSHLPLTAILIPWPMPLLILPGNPASRLQGSL